PKWLDRDRDSVYSETFRRRVAGMGIAEVISAPASAWQNPYGERVIGSIRRECLDHVIVLNQAHLRRVLSIYSWYYHRSRTHLGVEKGGAGSPTGLGTLHWSDHRDSGSRRAPSPVLTEGRVSFQPARLCSTAVR